LDVHEIVLVSLYNTKHAEWSSYKAMSYLHPMAHDVLL